MKATTVDAYKLLHDGCIALSQIEANGMRIDTNYLNKTIHQTGKKIFAISSELKDHKIYRTWHKHFGAKMNLGSREQLAKILFDVMDYPCSARTEGGKRAKADEEALVALNSKFVKQYLYLEKLKNARSTYLQGILRETEEDGLLHPFFNLNLVQTFRSQSDHPNFHNIHKKNPELAKMIRRAFIARPNHRIVETDYSKVEVCSAACYHKDPNMIKYLKNPKMDIHRDQAAECYIIPKSQITYEMRDCGKNQFVFPQLYGDYYIHCAIFMWNSIFKRKMRTVDGMPLHKHLRHEGITRLGKCDPDESPVEGTFEYHIREVERKFWNKKFKAYSQWKRDWWEEYLSKGWFEMLTGFRIDGVYNRKQIINYPMQGTAFHWLLWALIRIVKLLKKYHMRSLVTGQIHDSIVGDVHKREMKDYLSIVEQVMTHDILKHWKWIIVPLRVEAAVAPIGGSWYDVNEEFEI